MAFVVRRCLAHLALAVAAPILFLLLVEGLLRLLGMGNPSPATDPARGFLPNFPVFVERADQEGRRYLELRSPRSAFMKRRQFNPQRIPFEKESGEFRILVLGDSLAYGWPYDDRLSFPRVLEVGLAAVAPHPHWRVVNLGAPGWGSTRLRMLSGQLGPLDPDLVVINSGNNEFLETSFAREVMGLGQTKMQWWSAVHRRSHLLTLMAEMLVPIVQPMSAHDDANQLRSLEEHSRERLRALHRENLASITRTFVRSGSRVYLTTVPVNLRACPPFGRDAPGEALGPADLTAIRDYNQANALAEARDFSGAARVLEALIARHPKSASLRFAYGHTLAALGRFGVAREAYLQALDLDRRPLRASRPFNDNARTVASEMGVGLVDFEDSMRIRSKTGIPGEDLFLDNCHPNRVGTVVLALEVAREMAKDRLFKPQVRWESSFSEAAARHLAAVELSLEDKLSALEFLYYYFTGMNPQAQKASGIRRQILKLDPEHRFPPTESLEGDRPG